MIEKLLKKFILNKYCKLFLFLQYAGVLQDFIIVIWMLLQAKERDTNYWKKYKRDITGKIY